MKRYFVLIAVACIALSCRKDNMGYRYECSNRYTQQPNYWIITDPYIQTMYPYTGYYNGYYNYDCRYPYSTYYTQQSPYYWDIYNSVVTYGCAYVRSYGGYGNVYLQLSW